MHKEEKLAAYPAAIIGTNPAANIGTNPLYICLRTVIKKGITVGFSSVYMFCPNREPRPVPERDKVLDWGRTYITRLR